MRVKRLEIQGFKSFKDKTVVHFDHGITGIVGPNGCGKSNIVDAFFWVMGEQSYKHMRGTSSDDLIFNGSSKYSALGMAEATLVMETELVDPETAPAGASASGELPAPVQGKPKTKEISVTRRLYRTGEGEYFINGISARLKDIQELFMDTGVGAKGYSVIEQGQIGKIVNSKPEERRLLIEEAAGIAKYKARKKESLRKMEATQSNLSRLTDVIQEIERSLASLERQAQKARSYKKYKEELLDKEMTWGRRKSLVMRQRLESVQGKKTALEQELVGLRAELQISENSIEIDRVDQVTLGKRLEELQAGIQQLSDELSRDRSALDLSRRRQGDLASQLEALEGEKQDLLASLTEDKERMVSQESELEELAASYDAANGSSREQDLEVQETRRAAELARHSLDAAKRELMTGVTQSSDLSSRDASLAAKVESIQAQSEKLLAQTEELNARLTQAREDLGRTTETLESLRARRDGIAEELQQRSTDLRSKEEGLKHLEKAREDSSRELMQLKSRVQSLEELSSAHEGLADGPKAALEWADANGMSDKLLTLADALEVSNGFDAAVAGWLESRLESLLADDPQVAASALARIRDDKQGRVAIQVGGMVQQLKGNSQQLRGILEDAGFDVVGELSQFVSVNPQMASNLREMASAILANVIVVRSFDCVANFISDGGAAQLGFWSLVSLDGSTLDAVESGYVLRGGSTENDSSSTQLRRKRAIAELQAQAAQAETRAAETETAAAAALSDLNAVRETLAGLKTELQTCDVQSAGLERDLHQANRTVREIEGQLQSFSRETESLKRSEEQARAERESIQDRVSQIVGARTDLEEKIAAGEAELSTREQALREQEEALQTAKMTEVSLRERLTSIKRELESVRGVVASRERRVTDIQRTVERAMQEREQFTGGESELATRIEELTVAVGISREELSGVRNRMEESSAKLNGALERIKELHKLGDHKTADANQLALEFEKLNSDLLHLVQNLEEKYGPGCLERPVTSPIQEEMTEPVVTAEMTAEEEQALGEEVERLRERIRRLGEVNVMAIEEYEELKKRYDYLLTEKTDLERSIENLQDAIEHINKTSEERFKKAFDAIADRFERLFPIIFGGGMAKLSLVYPEGSSDILDAGVDILAQPPGKKVVNIGLLSGGEKALTAVSLIFAIFMVKPSPFCVLDEVDAPLDDANIGKFNALLREMAAKSQFILITHNKKTMELNDTLYGVTMEEPGVSKMVSIEMK
ncbi:MAG: chromosome segregation protein SMC [Bdellovibrionales bacterium GWB1_55_8]|nr:MAG: chromosome segregation protein SMC [Bdellovibrionales bacterium GWB1_55_8]